MAVHRLFTPQVLYLFILFLHPVLIKGRSPWSDSFSILASLMPLVGGGTVSIRVDEQPLPERNVQIMGKFGPMRRTWSARSGRSAVIRVWKTTISRVIGLIWNLDHSSPKINRNKVSGEIRVRLYPARATQVMNSSASHRKEDETAPSVIN